MSKSGDKDSKSSLYCSFCGKSQHEVRKLIAGPSVFVCDECVELCRDIIHDENKSSLVKSPDGIPTPKEICTVLDDYVERAIDLSIVWPAGRSVPQNNTLAAYWYRRAAEQGNVAGQHLLGLMYDKGFGVPPDYVLAHMWLNLAAARTKGDVHEDNIRLRDAVAGKMSLGQLADAQYLAVNWIPKPERF